MVLGKGGRVLLGFAQRKRFGQSIVQQKELASTSALSSSVVASVELSSRSGIGVLGDEMLDIFFAFVHH